MSLATVLDGKRVSEERLRLLKPRVERFTQNRSRPPHLAVVLVGEDPASQVYVNNKQKACAKVGIQSSVFRKSSDLTQRELEALISQLNHDDQVDAILVQLPLPKKLDASKITNLILPEKDADGFTDTNLGALVSGKPRVIPCTPLGVMEILNYYQISLSGKSAVVIGRSNIVGKPMAQLLTQADATVTLCHSKTKNIREYLKFADIVVVAAGQKKFFSAHDFKNQSVIIDVGIHRNEGGGVCGDVDFESVSKIASAITPVPGGVGPMTITCLLENTVDLAELRSRI